MHLLCLTQLICKKPIIDEKAENDTILLKNKISEELINAEKYVLTNISASYLKDSKEFIFKVHRKDSETLIFRIRPGFLDIKFDQNNPVKVVEIINLSSKYASLERKNSVAKDFVEIIRIRCINCTRDEKKERAKVCKTSRSGHVTENDMESYLTKIEIYAEGNPDKYDEAFDKIGELINYEDNPNRKKVYCQRITDLQELFDNVCNPDNETIGPAIKKSRGFSCIKHYYKNLECGFFKTAKKKDDDKKEKKDDDEEEQDDDKKEPDRFLNYHTIEIDHNVPNIGWQKSVNLKTLILQNWNPDKLFIPWKNLETNFQIWHQLTYLDMSNSSLTQIPDYVIQKMPQSLSTLRLANNSFEKLSSAISHIKELKVLSLSNNAKLSDEGFPWESLPESLEELYLENTNLEIVQAAIKRLNLKKFVISGENLNIISWESFPSEIEEIYISCGNQVNLMKDLKYLIKLRIFHLRNANLSLHIWEKLPQSLQTIDLSFNHISVLKCHYFLPNITTVILKNNKLYNVLEDIGKNLPNLVMLDLESNDFVEFFSPLTCLKKLEVLNLSNNKFEIIHGEMLPSTLKELYLSNNQISSITSIELLFDLIVLNLTKNNLKIQEPSRAFPCNITKLGKLQFLFLAGNELTVLPHGFENLKNLRFLDLSYNNFYHKLNNISNDLWDRLPTFISTLYLSGNNLGELPCQLSKLSLDYLEAKDCSLQHICPQLRNYTANENPKIVESLLFDGKRIIDVRHNDDLLQLSFVPNQIYPDPPKTDSSDVDNNGLGDTNFVLLTNKADKKRLNFQKNRFPIKKFKPFYDFSVKDLTVQEEKQLCQCCARCGINCGSSATKFETVMVMDFCLATVKEEIVADKVEDNLTILEVPIKPEEEIQAYTISESWKRAAKNIKFVFDYSLTKILPKKWKTTVRTTMCHRCIESMKTEIAESYKTMESNVSTPSSRSTSLSKNNKESKDQATCTVVSTPQNHTVEMYTNSNNRNLIETTAAISLNYTSYNALGHHYASNEMLYPSELSNQYSSYSDHYQVDTNFFTGTHAIYSNPQMLSNNAEVPIYNHYFCPDLSSVNNNNYSNLQQPYEPFPVLAYPASNNFNANDLHSVPHLNNLNIQTAPHPHQSINNYVQDQHFESWVSSDADHFVYPLPLDEGEML